MTAPKFGWLSPVSAHAGSDFKPIVMYQEAHILPHVAEHFDAVWVSDHFWGFDAEKREGFLEAWTTLTWLAAKFPTLGLCHHVLGHGYRPPALTAKMAATLQVLSGGRFMLGIGSGWREAEYRAYGYEFPKASVRIAQLEEVVEICRLMWTEPHPTFHGRYFTIEDAAAPPLPEVAPKICIGSSGKQLGLPLVGRRADVWNGFFDDEADWAEKRDIVFAAAVEAGRDPSEIECCITVSGDPPGTDSASQEWIDRLARWREVGVGYFVMDFGHPLDPEPALRFVEQVMPVLRTG
jgi:alkanesulfonate monooxygenase SsuD/methylene tetrahydromethanopterin reductase-like flavin-dependent oxidoreductase (luciferase family)